MYVYIIYTLLNEYLSLQLIKNIQKYDVVLLRLPAFEKAVSQVLLNIKVGRRCVIQHINWVTVRLRVLYMCRKFMPKVMVSQYEQQLQQLITTLSDYRGRRNYPKVWPTDLSTYEIVIETLVLSNYFIYIYLTYIYIFF